jgi:hypothetical protein
MTGQSARKAPIRIEIPSAGEQPVEVMVGETLHNLVIDLDVMEDGPKLYGFLSLIDDLQGLREQFLAENPDGEFKAFLAMVVSIREYHPRIRTAVDDIFGEGAFAKLFGEGNEPLFRGLMLLIGIEPVMSTAYDSLLAGFKPED